MKYNSEVHASLRKVDFPAEISCVKVHIETDVIGSDLLLLLSRSEMQEAKQTFEEIKLQCLEKRKIYISSPVTITVSHCITTVRSVMKCPSLIKRELPYSLTIWHQNQSRKEAM